MNKLVGYSCLLMINSEFESEGIRGLLANRGLKSTTTVSDMDSVSKTLSRVNPDVIVVDAGDFTDAPLELIRLITRESRDSKIILLFDEQSLKNNYLSSDDIGAGRGFGGVKLLLRSTLRDGDRMAEVIERLLNEDDSVESDVVDLLVQNVVKHSESLLNKLTKRELQVLALAGDGAVNKTIAHQLNKSPAYIGNTFTQIFTKLEFRQKSNINPRIAACRQYFLEFGLGEKD